MTVIRVNVIGKSNGAGLTRDIGLLTDALRAHGCEVSVTVAGSRQSRQRKSALNKLARLSMEPIVRWIKSCAGIQAQPHYDLNVMLEHVWVQYLSQARINVIVPNPEFFDRHDVAAIRLVDGVWAKTVTTQSVFTRLGIPVTHIGFDSEDRRDKCVVRKKAFFHLAGSSALKGTARLLDLWRRHPEWPNLMVVGRVPKSGTMAANIKVITDFVDDAELRRLQNACTVHLCTSETEGWGHYLVESLGVGAAVVTLGAPPMNELVTEDRGILLSCQLGRRLNLAQCYLFDEDALVKAVQGIGQMSQHDLMAMGSRGRKWFLNNKAGFSGRIGAAVDALGSR